MDGLTVIRAVTLPDPLYLHIQEEALYHRVDSLISRSRYRVFQVGQDKWVKLTNDVAL